MMDALLRRSAMMDALFTAMIQEVCDDGCTAQEVCDDGCTAQEV